GLATITAPARSTAPARNTARARNTEPAPNPALTAALRPAPITRRARAIPPGPPRPAGITGRRWPSGSAPGRCPSRPPTTRRTAPGAIRLAHRVLLADLIPEHYVAGPVPPPPATAWPLPEPVRGQ